MNSIRIIDLIKLLDKEAKIKIIGIRPGEKVHESLFSIDEARIVNQNRDSFIIYNDYLSYKKKFGKKLVRQIAYTSSNKELLNINKINHFLKGYLRKI